MRKGVLKITACCLAGTMAFAGNGVVTMASGFDIAGWTGIQNPGTGD